MEKKTYVQPGALTVNIECAQMVAATIQTTKSNGPAQEEAFSRHASAGWDDDDE